MDPKMSAVAATNPVVKPPKPFPCDMCTKSFSQKSGLERHKRFHNGIKPYSCEDCDKTFYTKQHLGYHRAIHDGTLYSCDTCDKKFNNPSHLKTHKKIHTGEKPYSCDICQKSFSQKNGLNAHMKIHAGQTTFTCNECALDFDEKVQLMNHRMIMHPSAPNLSNPSSPYSTWEATTVEKAYNCDHCYISFSNRTSFVQHSRMHSDRKQIGTNYIDM